MAVIAARTDDLVAVREPARQPNRAHARLRAGIGHADLFDAWNQFANDLAILTLEQIRKYKAGAIIGGGFIAEIIFGCAWPRIAGPQVPT